MTAAVLAGSELCSGKGWVALPSPSHSIPVWDFLWHSPLLMGVGKPQPDLFCLGWFDNPKGHGDDGKGFRASCFLPITTGCLSPTSTGPFFCREGRGRASGGAACRKACESGPCFLIPVLSVGSEFPNLNLCIPREWQCSESTLLLFFFSVVCFSHVGKQVVW